MNNPFSNCKYCLMHVSYYSSEAAILSDILFFRGDHIVGHSILRKRPYCREFYSSETPILPGILFFRSGHIVGCSILQKWSYCRVFYSSETAILPGIRFFRSGHIVGKTAVIKQQLSNSGLGKSEDYSVSPNEGVCISNLFMPSLFTYV